MKRFVPKYLDPASRLGEILFGLIMVLTVTLTAGLTVDEGRAGVRQLLFAAIGVGLSTVIGPRTLLNVTAQFGLTGHVPDVRLITSIPIRF